MYNRYIPQGDGTYRRSRIPDSPPPEPPEPAPEPKPTPPPPPQAAIPPPRPNGHTPPRQDPQGTNLMSFLHQILPQNFDTGDLIVVLLLLLMSENRKDNTALLTLVIYLFL